MRKYRVISYSNLRGQKRVLDDSRAIPRLFEILAESDEQAVQKVHEQVGLAQDVELYGPEAQLISTD